MFVKLLPSNLGANIGAGLYTPLAMTSIDSRQAALKLRRPGLPVSGYPPHQYRRAIWRLKYADEHRVENRLCEISIPTLFLDLKVISVSLVRMNGRSWCGQE